MTTNLHETLTAFFAYPSSPAMVGGTVRRATADLSHRTELAPVTWEDLKERGRGPLIIADVLEAIESAAVSIFEVTTLNQNVLFELGFAIGRERRVWLIRDPSHAGADRAWQEFQVLTGIRYSEYQNSQQIVEAFASERPWDKPETVYSLLIGQLPPAGIGSLLYLKSRHETDAERELSRKVDQQRRAGVPVVVSDPAEGSAQPLGWYAEQVYRSTAVLVHLTGSSRVEASVHNARGALVAGMAHGMGRPLLMLAEADYTAPLDYQDLLRIYRNAEEAVQRAEQWMLEHLEGVAEAAKRTAAVRTRLRLANELSSLRLGEPVAEMEELWLEDYFVPTAAFGDVMAPRTTVFVGRKGTGKTANLLRAAQVLEADKRNLVTVIRPPGYELESIVRLLRQYTERDTKGYLVEALWKFLLTSEVALTAYQRIQERSVSPQEGTPEWKFSEFLRERPFLLEDFAVRLEQSVQSVLGAKDESSIGDARTAISERLHGGVLQELRKVLGPVLKDSERVAILIDNLDKAWERSADIDQLSYLLLGLLAAIGPVAEEFGKADRWRQPVRVSVAVFLRSDIYARIARVAREPDRIPLTRLLWQDRDLLLRIVEDRYRAARNEEVEGSELWDMFFVPSVAGQPVREYVASRILSRPRDLLMFCNAAITSAVNRGHSIVELDDLEDAERNYSLFALEALKVETGLLGDRIEEVLYEFAGGASILEQADALASIRHVVADPGESQEILEQLRSLSFFGIETAPDRFSHAEEPAERARDEALANRFETRHSRAPRLEVHPAFRRYLEIEELVA
jgi:hypothetical protein